MKKIFKRILCTLLLTFLIIVFTGCGNRSFIDTTWSFDYAYIKLPNGEVVEGKVEKWYDYSDSDVVQIKINGVWYLTHYNNVVMIDK